MRGLNGGRSLNCYTKVLPATVISIWTCRCADFFPYLNAEILFNCGGRAERQSRTGEVSETGQKSVTAQSVRGKIRKKMGTLNILGQEVMRSSTVSE